MHLVKIKKWFPLWAVLAVFIFSIGTVWLRLTIVRITYDIHQMERAIDQNKQVLDTLQIKISELKSPKRLEHLARTQYQLKPPHVKQVIPMRQSEQKPEPSPKGN